MTHQKAIDPNLWGSSAWYILHRLSFEFRNVKEGRSFYESLLTILPCPKCRESFGEHLQKNPFPSNHKDIPQWCIDLHNMVNRSIGKSAYHETSMKNIRMQYAQPSEVEWTFISALLDSHPGKRYISHSYTEAMSTFLKYWVKGWHGVSMPSHEQVQSKTLLKRWVHKNNRRVIGFSVCSTNTCELRAGRD